MADLETAAAEALDAIHQLEARIVDANAKLNQLREGSLEAIEHQCDAVWGRLEQEVESFQQQVAEKQGALHEFGRDTLGSLAGTRDTLNQAYEAASGHLNEAKALMAQLHDHVAGAEPQLASMTEGLQAAAHALVQQLAAADAELQQAAQQARTLIGSQLPQELHHMQEEVQQRAAALHHALVEECQTPIETQHADWQAKLLEVTTTVKNAFTETSEHAEQVTSFSIEKCQQAFEETFKELDATAHTIDQALRDYEQAVQQASKESLGAAKELDSDVLDTIDALGGASSTVNEILKTLARYAFTTL